MILSIHVYALFENYKKSCDKFTQKRKPSTVLRKEALHVFECIFNCRQHGNKHNYSFQI
jgi:hypothetical protein